MTPEKFEMALNTDLDMESFKEIEKLYAEGPGRINDLEDELRETMNDL